MPVAGFVTRRLKYECDDKNIVAIRRIKLKVMTELMEFIDHSSCIQFELLQVLYIYVNQDGVQYGR